MAPTAEELAHEISALAHAATSRIVRLSPERASSYLSLLKGSPSHELVSAVETYLVVARRAELHPDADTIELFRQADNEISKHLGLLAGTERTLFEQEHAQRRLALLADPDELAARTKAARRHALDRLPPAGGILIDIPAAFLQRRFFELLQKAIGTAPSARTPAEALLVSAHKKLSSVIGGAWREGWGPAFTYLSKNTVELAEHGQELKAAREALEKAIASTDPSKIKAAEAAELLARQKAGGYLSKVKGLLGEAYVPRWRDWLIQLKGFREVAEREAATLPGKWTVRVLTGDLRLGGKETWDQAILLVEEESGTAKLFLAAQFKVEKQVTALEQVQKDALRETTPSAESLAPILTFSGEGQKEAWRLEPLPAGRKAYRYVFNASGGRFSPSEIKRLKLAGIEVNQFNLDISTREMDAIADALLEIVSASGP